MENFRMYYESLSNKLGDNVNLSAMLDFITYFRCDDINLYREFISGYNEVGYYDVNKLISMYCKSSNISLNDENAKSIFLNLVDNIWNNNMAYHLTTSVSALNIYENGMDPSKKETDIIEDIHLLSSLLSEDKRKCFFPYAVDDITKYSYSTIPKLNVNYGRKPEWYLNLTLYNKGSLNEVLGKILPKVSDESSIAKEKMVEVISKYHSLYENSSRTLVVIPGLSKKLPNELVESFGVHDVSTLEKGVEFFLGARRNGIDMKSDKVVSSSELMFIDTKTKSIVDFNNMSKSI